MNIQNRDPLFELYQSLGFDKMEINEIVCGNVYNFVAHRKYHSGVAATLSNTLQIIPSEIDFQNITHRSLLLSYYNSIFNTESKYKKSSDLISEMNLKTNQKIAMIGFFKPLIPYFTKNNIFPIIFDDFYSIPEVTSNSQKPDILSKSEVLIITATSIINNTFCKEIALLQSNAKIFILGTSALMIPYFKEEFGVERIFGSIVMDSEGVKHTIINGGGTPSFSKFIQKAVF